MRSLLGVLAVAAGAVVVVETAMLSTDQVEVILYALTLSWSARRSVTTLWY
jgi:hypothetical protein